MLLLQNLLLLQEGGRLTIGTGKGTWDLSGTEQVDKMRSASGHKSQTDKEKTETICWLEEIDSKYLVCVCINGKLFFSVPAEVCNSYA